MLYFRLILLLLMLVTSSCSGLCGNPEDSGRKVFFRRGKSGDQCLVTFATDESVRRPSSSSSSSSRRIVNETGVSIRTGRGSTRKVTHFRETRELGLANRFNQKQEESLISVCFSDSTFTFFRKTSHFRPEKIFQPLNGFDINNPCSIVTDECNVGTIKISEIKKSDASRRSERREGLANETLDREPRETTVKFTFMKSGEREVDVYVHATVMFYYSKKNLYRDRVSAINLCPDKSHLTFSVNVQRSTYKFRVYLQKWTNEVRIMGVPIPEGLLEELRKLLPDHIKHVREALESQGIVVTTFNELVFLRSK